MSQHNGSSDGWFYRQYGVKFGPVSRLKLRELVTTGQVQPRQIVWQQSTQDQFIVWAATVAFGTESKVWLKDTMRRQQRRSPCLRPPSNQRREPEFAGQNDRVGREMLAQQSVSDSEKRLREYLDGVLILRGCLPTYYLKQLARQVVVGLEGVEHIDNQIDVVMPPFRSRQG